MSESAKSKMGLDRMLFFSDAVFAIAITLLALDMKVPIESIGGGEQQLQKALLGLIPTAIGFVVSFLLIGQTWIEHHRIGELLCGIDRGLLWWDLLLLMFVASIPFATSLVSSHYASITAVCLYATGFGLLGIFKAGYWRHAVRHGLVRATGNETREIGRRVWAAPLVSTVVIVLALLGVPYSYVAFGSIPLIARVLSNQGH